MTLIVDSREYLSCLDCIVDPTKQSNATASKLQDFALKKLLPACKVAKTAAQLREVQEYSTTYKILAAQFAENSHARACVAEAAAQLEKCKNELFAAHPLLKQLSKEWSNTEELWEMLSLANRSIKEEPALEQLLPPKFLKILTTVKRMRKTAADYLDKQTTALYAAYDKATNNKFSSLMQIYGYIDLRVNKSEIISSLVKVFLLFHTNPLQMESEFAKEVYQQIDLVIQKHVPYYEWLKENIPFIVNAYNHGNENDAAGGACRQNCTARQLLLLKNPKMATKDLPLGSSEWTRKQRDQLKEGPRLVLTEQMSTKQMGEPFYAPFGLQLDEMEGLDKLEDLPQLLGKHTKPLLLRLADETVGHVINVQCDTDNEIFRFVCDGIGSVEYKSKEALIKGIQSYLKVFYPGWGHFLVDFTSLIRK